MELSERTERYLTAWRDGDAEAVASTVDSYADPDTPDPLSGPPLAAHVGEMFARFSGLALAIENTAVAGDTAVITWTLTAVHRAAYLGIPGTGGDIRVTGTDVLSTRDGTVHVRRYFDRLAVTAALGYQARFVPESAGDTEFGISSRTSSGRVEQPGALTLTWLDVRDEAEGADVDLLSVEVVKSLRATSGFLGVGTFDIGTRKYTLTAFDKPESVRSVHARAHQRAMRRFFRSGLCTGAFTSVWTLARESYYARCADCGAMIAAGAEQPCDCGWTPEPDPLF